MPRLVGQMRNPLSWSRTDYGCVCSNNTLQTAVCAFATTLAPPICCILNLGINTSHFPHARGDGGFASPIGEQQKSSEENREKKSNEELARQQGRDLVPEATEALQVYLRSV